MGSLRLFLALSVALGHFGMGPGLPTSDVAVQCFYVMSGFYMALVLNEKYGPGSYWLFISNRVLRLWPTYIVVAALSFAVTDNWRPLAALNLPSLAYFAASQILILGQDTYVFLFIKNGALAATLHPAGLLGLLYTHAPVPQAWTLALESYFYLLAPLVVRRGPVVIAGVIALSLLVRATLLAFGFSGEPWTYRFFPNELALFLAGSLGYHIYSSRSDDQRKRVQFGLALVAGLLFVCLAISNWGGVSRLPSLSLLVAVIFGIPSLFEQTKNIPWDRYLGELSYPLYICHYMFGWLLLPETAASRYLALSLSLLTSMLLYRWLEQPIDRWRQTRFRKAPAATETSGLVQAVS
ncbi:acyltransferase family protein [Bradyrhizobium sp. STM 3562]|uniref:acyltransferase family protein n=1 Tax=Bradyrhizobium sp. STM 3562 TaxID=578924 RepID=UPI00388ECB4B